MKQRISKDMNKLINEIRADYIKQGKRPPSASKITESIMKKYKVSKEDLCYDRFIKL